MTKRKWFRKAVMKRPPYTLGGWSKRLDASSRRRRALMSRPRSWSLRTRYRSAGRALIALANVTKDAETRRKARADARYFFSKLKKR